ncbi:efflux RND transporter periplasmic adaptor subunit [Tardiphaga sp. 841_E9_N1_2]|jgi:RND family efflux transporter MFP subunit|uniref:efflux RND transporter periplasmic adaptor subunit n=1 Tax=unclassified Tardiphaga TaxID=2631404 RepID=UPI003F21004C
MAIIAIVYALIVWLVFAKLKWLRWGWGIGTATVLVGLFIAALFAGCLNYLAPTGRVVVISRVVEVTPNVTGQITEISVKPNAPVKAGAVLFRIDPAPYEAQVRLVEAQLGFQELRLSQMKDLQASSAGRAFDVQERQSEVDQLKAQLDKAKYDLAQTTVSAPADGSVANLALSKGDRATSSKAVLSFLVADAVQLVGIFSQNGYQAIRPGARVQFALSNNPGHLYTSTIGEIVSGVGEGQIASSGELTRVTSLPMTAEYPALIDRPKEIDAAALRPGMSGTATAYAANSAPFDFFGWVLLYGRALALYL